MTEIPFPLMARQYVQITSGGKPYFLEIQAQSQPKIFKIPYVLLPGTELKDQIPSLGTLNIFDVDSEHLVQWVSWIDNRDLGVTWKINSQSENDLQGQSSPLTHEISPKGNTSAPFFLYNAPRANVTYTLSNLSSIYPIKGEFEIVLYVFRVKPVTAPPAVYTVAAYSLAEATQ